MSFFLFKSIRLRESSFIFPSGVIAVQPMPMVITYGVLLGHLAIMPNRALIRFQDFAD
jgi:hypothetical protein